MGDLALVPEHVRGLVIAASVPGCIHTDLMDAGLIPDPAIGTHEKDVRWVGWTDWRYECAFDADPALFGHKEIALNFECLDTIATIELNGIEIGQAASEFIPWRFGVQGLLKQGRNTLAVTFTSPLRHVHEMATTLGHRPHNGDEQGWAPFNMIRKCASNFGWDWGPRVATCGMTAGVALVAVNGDGSDTSTGASTERPRVEFHPDPFHFTIGGEPVFIKGANWIPEGLWPRDRTPERVRRRLQQLLDANMNMIRVWGGGRYEPDWFYDLCDEMGILVWQDFMFACACYPEEEPLRSLIEREARYQVARLRRHPCVVLWCGGNECHWAYESWGFKERLAASRSPQTWGKHYWREMLPKIVAELSPRTPYWPDSPWSGEESPHPNAADVGDRHTWDVWGDGFRTIVPRFCSEFGQQAPSTWRTLANAGLVHEEPSPPRESTGTTPGVRVVRAKTTSPDAAPRRERSPAPTDGGMVIPPALSARQLGPGGHARWYDEPMRAWFREPRDLDEWHAMAHLLQARSLQIGIEWMRAHRPRCMGALVWQLNDAWPGLSWSLIDSAGRPKLAYEGVKQSFAPERLTIQPIDGRPRAIYLHDGVDPATEHVDVMRLRLDGTVLACVEGLPIRACRDALADGIDLEGLVGSPHDEREEMLVVDASVNRATWWYAPDRALHHRVPVLSWRVDRRWRNAIDVRVRSSSIVRDLWIDATRLPDGWTVQSVPPFGTLLPEETMFVFLRYGSDESIDAPAIDLDGVFRPPVLWSATTLHADST